MPSMDVWIDDSGTDSQLTAARIGRLAAQYVAALGWQPFFLPPVRDQQGPDFPFPDASARTAHVWRDLERCAHQLGIPTGTRRPTR